MSNQWRSLLSYAAYHAEHRPFGSGMLPASALQTSAFLDRYKLINALTSLFVQSCVKAPVLAAKVSCRPGQYICLILAPRAVLLAASQRR